MANVIILIAILFGFFACAACYFMEIYTWNKGVCRETNTHWKYIGVDSDGRVGYSTEDGKYSAWFFWINTWEVGEEDDGNK